MQLTAHSAARASVRGSLAFVTVAALALGLTACSGSDDPVPTPTVTVDPNIDADKNAAPEPVVPIVWPLTGVAVEEVPARPAIAVKVENTAAARPQSGLEDADIVWETIVEYEVSRFIAVFNSNLPKEVGPVRSARPVDLRVVTPANPLFVFSGAQKKMVQRIAKSDVQAISHDAGAAGLSRSSARRAPHNVYANLETISKAADAEHSAAPAQQFTYAADAATASAAATGTDTKTISLNLSAAAKPSWQWSKDAWKRSEGSAKAMNAKGDQLQAVNVVVIEVEQIDSGLNAQGGTMVPDNVLEGRGKALVATGGKTLEVEWVKKDKKTPLTLEKDGQPINLAPGNTWVELMPKGTGSYKLS